MSSAVRFGREISRILQSSSKSFTGKRYLSLQEYQATQILEKNGIHVGKFAVAHTPAEADSAASRLDANKYVVKAQILAGGKGKGHFNTGFKGGVHVTNNRDEVSLLAAKMLGNRLITKQTGPNGVEVKTVTVVAAANIKRELYLAIIMDREHSSPLIIASPAGGMDIETVAAQTPELIFKEIIDIKKGCTREQARRMATNLGFEGGKTIDQAVFTIQTLYNIFRDTDATQMEINPLAELQDGTVACLDCKLGLDDNADFRQEHLFALKDNSDVDPRELEAAKYHLNYIPLDGNIACLVNGAGLAMATMDIIKLHGGEPANFLDVGGSVTSDQVRAAFGIITSDPNIKAILVNIFGGIVNCSTIATGIIEACKSLDKPLAVPLIVRLEGTNVDGARKLLKESGLPITPATDITDAAIKAVQSVKK